MINVVVKELSLIFAEAEALSSHEDKVNHFRNNDSLALRELIDIYFNETFDLPAGAPWYTATLADNEAYLYREIRRLYRFFPRNNRLTKTQKAEQFTRVLSTLTPGDAKLLLAIKDKTLPYDKEFFDEVFLGIVPPAPKKPEEKTQVVRNKRGRFEKVLVIDDETIKEENVEKS